MTDAYNSQGTSQWVWIDADDLTSLSAPSAAELEDGIIIGDDTLSLKSPSVKPNTVDATPITSNVTETINALAGIENAEFTIRAGDLPASDSLALFTTMKAKIGDSGYLVFVSRGKIDGIVAGNWANVYPSVINTVSFVNLAPGAPVTWTLAFAHSGAFHEAVTVAA